jgi:hypothetical protein
MILVGKIAIGFGTAALAGTSLLCSEGFVNVNVTRHNVRPNDGPAHIHVIAPAILAPIAARLIPDRKLADAADKLQPWLPTVRAAIDGLGDSPDMTLVEVSNPDEYVHVSKSGGSIVVDVSNVEENVHVSVPLSAIDSTISAIAADAPSTSGDRQQETASASF